MKFLLILSLTSSIVLALTSSQIEKIKVAHALGKLTEASNGMTFEYALPAIMGQETSFGSGVVIGDNYTSTGRLKSLYDSSLGDFQIKLSTAKLTIIKYPSLFKKYGYMVNIGKSTYKEYKYHLSKILYYEKIINSDKWKERVSLQEKSAIKTMKWAKKEYLYHYSFYVKLQKQARQDTMLINALMTNFKLSAEIAVHYLLSMYEVSLKKFGTRQAYWKAIGRYNGGWSNRDYYDKVKGRMVTVKKYF